MREELGDLRAITRELMQDFSRVTICNQMSLFQKDDTTGKTGCLSNSLKTNFKMFNAFADKDKNPELPDSGLEYTFSEQNENSTERITIHNESPA